jgi:Alpha/beta hydrolase domain
MNRQGNRGPGTPGSPVRQQARRLGRILVAAGAAIVVASTGTAAALAGGPGAGTGVAGNGTTSWTVPLAGGPGAGTGVAGNGTTSWTTPTAARGRGVPRPQVIGPITGGAHGRPFTSSPLPLKPAGYVQQEFFIRGKATGYLPVGKWTSNGRWRARPAETAPYETRILVRRPANPAKFNGTVVVEWLNVSFQVDVDPDFLYESQQLLREGYAWVGVSAQQLGVQGPLGLTHWDPKRYHALHHPGDTFSYSIFSQAAESLLNPLGAHPLGSLRPRLLLADGESQSAFRMVTYANAIQPLDHLFSGFLIHSRGGAGAPISQPPQQSPTMPKVARIRADLGVPTLTVETETDISPSGLGYLPATQPDTQQFRLWEVPGTSHVDLTELGLASTEVLRDVPAFPQLPCSAQPNQGQERYVMDAALAQLNNWARSGTPAPAAPLIKIKNGRYVTDKYGNAVGGVRTPAVQVPTATLTGLGNTGSNPLCFLLGTTTPLSSKQLAKLYPNHAVYVLATERAAAQDARAGFLLPADEQQIDATAAASEIGLPPPTG